MLWLLLVLAFAGLLALPAVVCCLAGGWLLLAGLPALACWLLLGWWVLSAWLDWRRRLNAGGDDYV